MSETSQCLNVDAIVPAAGRSRRMGQDKQLLGLVTDVSTNGLSISTEKPPKVGETVRVRAVLRDSERSVRGEVVRVQRVDDFHYVVGIAYDLLALEEDPFLEEALRKSLPS